MFQEPPARSPASPVQSPVPRLQVRDVSVWVMGSRILDLFHFLWYVRGLWTMRVWPVVGSIWWRMLWRRAVFGLFVWI